jgi:cytochrome c oxidase subunit 3
MSQTATLPSDKRYQQGGNLFLVSLLMFFLGSIIMYGLYAYWRRDDPLRQVRLPSSLLVSTLCLFLISAMVHVATRLIRREKRFGTMLLLAISTVSAVVFLGVQLWSMNELVLSFRQMSASIYGPVIGKGMGQGVVGMVIVLAFLHALHVGGGVIALGIVSVRSMQGQYDHERHWPVDFAAHYWHFLDIVWLCMLAAFWTTTGGFQL